MSKAPVNEYYVEAPSSIAVTGTASAAVLSANVPATLVWLKADATNASPLYVGGASVSTSVGYPLNPGDVMGPIPVTNLNNLYIVGNTLTGRVFYTTRSA